MIQADIDPLNIEDSANPFKPPELDPCGEKGREINTIVSEMYGEWRETYYCKY